MDVFTGRLLTRSRLEVMRQRGDEAGLTRALRSPDPDLRFYAISALGELRVAGAVPELAAILNDTTISGLRFAAARSLGAIGEPAVPALVPALSHPDPEVRWMAALALGDVGGSHTAVLLRPLLSDNDTYVAGRAGRAIAQAGRPGEEVLAAALSDPSPGVRVQAVRALSRRPHLPGLAALVRSLHHADPYISHVAGQALSRLCYRDPDWIREAIREATDADRVNFSAAVRIAPKPSQLAPLRDLREAAGETWALLPFLDRWFH